MRLRAQTIPPLPDLKAWFVPRPTGAVLAVKTISDLKKVLCHDIEQLSQGGHSFNTIRLLLDGFELLDDLPYEEVLRDGNLIQIQASKETFVEYGGVKKRKRHDAFDGVPTKKRKKSFCARSNNKSTSRHLAKASTSSGSSSDVETSSLGTTSESNDESESSDSSSSTSSDSEASSESSEESASSLSTSKKKPSRASILRPKVPAVSPVPPGLGKPSTHSRNRRRKLKRLREKEVNEAQSAPPRGTSDVNLIPLKSIVSEKPSNVTESNNEISKTQSTSSERRNGSSPPATLDNSNGDIMMMSLRNKNKKKNFRQTIVAPAVRKIVFDDDGNVQLAGAVTPVPDTTCSIPSQQVGERVLPPSQLAAIGLLPSNMFVTSVEFGRQPKKKQRLRDTQERAYEDEDESRFEDANIHLSYGDEEETGNNERLGSDFDWDAAEIHWERFPPVKSLDQLQPGVLACWQHLAINPETFTPENMLSVGRVETKDAETITVRRLSRPRTEKTAAFGICQEDEEETEEDYRLEDVSSLGWRLVEL